LRFVLKSFARHAPVDVSLVIKRHPLDPGLVPWERETRRLAAQYGVADRVFYLADWDIAEIVHHSIGVVTVNSTVGTLALNDGKPVTVLGHAVYKVPGIVHHGPLDAFWSAPQPPSLPLYAAFRQVLLNKCLIRGGLLSDEGLAMLVDNAVTRLTADRVIDIMPKEWREHGEMGIYSFPPPPLARRR
jgi:capsular polysaccharide export protein